MNRQWTMMSAALLIISGCLATCNAFADCGNNNTGNGCDCDCKYTSHSFFYVRPQFQSASPERVTLFRDPINAREEGRGGAVQAVFFGGESRDRSKVAKFFTPFCKSTLLVSTDLADNPDILPQHFNIQLPEFKSTICLNMEQKVFGFGLDWKQGFWKYREDQWLWFEVSMPIEHIENKVILKETVDTEATTAVTGIPTTPINMVEAFKQTAFCFGKIDCGHCNEITKVADVEIKLGYEWLKNDCCFLESYIGALCPAGNVPCARYMFEPIAGHNHHAGVLIGGSGSFDFWYIERCGASVTFAFDSDARYLFDRCERRSFDLKYRPWSRYMQVYANKEQAQQAFDDRSNTLFTPGINAFTQPLCVKPRLAVSSNEALILNYKKLQAEIGYNLYTRQAECVKLACKWQDTIALKQLGQDGEAVPFGSTNNIQGINYYNVCTDQPLANYNKNIITADDLNLESAAHPAVFSNTVYGSLGLRWEDYKFPCFLGVGASYEWCDDFSALNRWNAWLKGGVSF